MNDSKPWRRDAWRWGLKYGAIVTVAGFGCLRISHHTPAFELQPSLSNDGPTALGWGILIALIGFVVRWRGALVDMDELEAAGRGGLGLRRRRKPATPESDDTSEGPPSTPGDA